MEDRLRHLAEYFEGLGRGLSAEHDRHLFEDDDHPDASEHPVDDRGRKELAEQARPQESEGHLNDARHATDRQRQPIGLEILGGILPCGVAEGLHGSENDDDQPRCGTLDRQLRVAEKGR
jgi:hypothetical protein